MQATERAVQPEAAPLPLRPGLSILVPAYNEEESLDDCLSLIRQAAAEASEQHELVIVNDGSSDRTGEMLEAMTREWDDVRVFHHETNQGIGGGITTAGRLAVYDKAIMCPVDSPLTAAQIRVFLEKAAPDTVVVGYRPERMGYKWWQLFGTRVYHLLARWLYRLPLRDVNWIHLYPTKLFHEIDLEFSGIVYLPEVLVKARRLGYKLVEVESPMVARIKGVATISKPRVIWHTFWDLWRLWWRMNVRR